MIQLFGPLFLQIRLYDISAQRRPVVSVDFRESPIKVVREDPNGHTVYAGTGTGDLASFDMRTGAFNLSKPLISIFLFYFYAMLSFRNFFSGMIAVVNHK